ncbi:hypothetical protein BDA99DRAFT_494611 [Phascolomyces articulosus]|uniref:Uncharacterized protein n=1 Tax=Phascolomyces articulosus TaxID=60185 RepID=A0AAD5PJ80_9FUNG|nr:hypothetical protein BDA99DRAFT_494611 [Phascolomyces articulosus]
MTLLQHELHPFYVQMLHEGMLLWRKCFLIVSSHFRNDSASMCHCPSWLNEGICCWICYYLHCYCCYVDCLVHVS